MRRSPATPDLPPLIVIAGATATGKTALAVELAVDLADGLQRAEIVSADSRQVYRGMDIATAKASPAERAAVRHHCLDLVDPDEPFTVADFQRRAWDSLTSIARSGGVALLVGGTGLYLRAIARGLPLDHQDSDAGIRRRLNERLDEEGLEPLVDELTQRDPQGATTIDRRNPRRVVRALERAIISGVAVPPPPRGYPAPLLWLGLRLEAEEHRAIIEARVEKHFATGLLDEARDLREHHGEDLPAFSAMGYREAFDVLEGRSSLAEAKARDAQRTWAYVRRQRTWFRTEPDITWLDAGEGALARARDAIVPWLRQVAHSDYAGSK